MVSGPADGQHPASTDILVIGGGIQGAGIAQAAAAAGYAVTLVEKTDWAAATSSNSSKLIHGGLRYLEQLQLGLVYESLRERDILCRIAPHLVRLNRFHIPVYRDSAVRPWKLWLGLSLYALLGKLGKSKLFSRLPQRQWKDLDGLDTRGLQAVFSYRDGQTDDALLTRAVVASARQLGTTIFCPAEFLAARAGNAGFRATFRHGNGSRDTHARVIVNAAGPWNDAVAKRVSPPPARQPFDLVQGSHLVLDRRLSDNCYYLEAPADRRAVFVMPWKETTLVGTTETPYHGDPGEARCTAAEEAYLLDTLRRYFPDFAAKTRVRTTMAGLRVLPRADGAVHARSRDVMIHQETLGDGLYIAVCGGKLTGYRATAETVVKRIAGHLGKRNRIADTARLVLPAANDVGSL